MKFAIITHAIHKNNNNKLFAYEPYVREMNLWGKYADEIKIVAPISLESISKIEKEYEHSNISILKIPSFDILNFKNKLKTVTIIPIIILRIFKVMFWADHIHLRCPGNVGLLGCFVQLLFPFKPKTVKYAGNWDPKSKQPLSYRIQKRIISNTFLTRNCKVLVYGEWKNQSKNIIPFFTASYNKSEIKNFPNKVFNDVIKFIFVGAFSKGKQPLLIVKVIQELLLKNYNVHLDMYGKGEKTIEVEQYIIGNKLDSNITLHGNKSKEIVKKAFQEAHFLLFISKSEGWPKVVAEAMFWKCLPISTNVSCVKYMLGDGLRGSVVNPSISVNELVAIILRYLENIDLYKQKVLNAQKWSQDYTLDKFSIEIKQLLND